MDDNKRNKISVDSRIAHFIEETDPNNPYGPNYYFLPHYTKQYYKYLRMSKFVHIDRMDEEALLNFNYIYYTSIILSTSLGYYISKGVSSVLLRRLTPRFYSLMTASFAIPFHGVTGSILCTSTYFYMNDYYSDNYTRVLYNKYINDAINNGFVDYPISVDR